MGRKALAYLEFEKSSSREENLPGWAGNQEIEKIRAGRKSKPIWLAESGFLFSFLHVLSFLFLLLLFIFGKTFSELGSRDQEILGISFSLSLQALAFTYFGNKSKNSKHSGSEEPSYFSATFWA